MNPLVSTYLPGSQPRLACHQELLILTWRLLEHNRRFLFHVLKTSQVGVIASIVFFSECLNAYK